MREKNQISFPPGKRLAVTVHFPVEWWGQRDEDDQKNYYHEYGAKVGAWRLLDVFDRAGIKGTCHLSGMVAELFPALVREIVRRGHDVAGHGYDQSNPQRLASPEEERAVVRKTLGAIENASGFRPRGWVCTGRRISKNTVRILAEEGLLWHSNHDRGDLPSVVEIDGKRIVDCPIQRYMNFDERRFLGMDGKGPPQSCTQILEFFQSQIDALRGAAQYEPLCFQFGSHAYLLGLPAYSWVLQQMLSYATSFADVWLVTSTEFARYWLETNAPTT
jgi:allantoinase